MVDPDRRPTAQEIEELIDLVRRDPGSPAFIDLGEAYLALGRPRDAIQVGNLGLESAPDNLEGRVMLARAFAAMHQWKEAQGELLRVVKVDRSNRQGFALLGEILLRRSDFERAVPVLQHAQNLDPTSPAILSMLRRARAGQALDPPAPIPQPMPPRGETDNSSDLQRSRHAPATVPQRSQRMAAVPPPGQMPMVPTASPAVPTMAIGGPMEPPSVSNRQAMNYADGSAGYPAPAQSMSQPSYSQPSYSQSYSQPSHSQPSHSQPSQSRNPKPSAPPPMSVEGVRPRIVSSAKVQNAAAASLRQSAAVGENYLNDLLTGGLLDVAGVRVPDQEFDLRPDRRWGRSTRRAFIFLFVVLVLGIGGGGTWYWWSEKQKSEQVARLQKEAKQLIAAGDYEGLDQSLKKLGEALKLDDANILTFTQTVETGGLAALLYGTSIDEVDRAHKSVRKDVPAGEAGDRELIIGKAAMELARMHTLQVPRTTLEEVAKALDEFLSKNPNDQWAKWLRGRAFLAAGERKAARTAFESAAKEDGLIVAMVDQANLAVDDGNLEEARALYKRAAQKYDADGKKVHPLVVLGSALARAEASVEANEVIGELNDKFVVTKTPPRVGSYRWLAFALANINTEDYPGALEALKKATIVSSTSAPSGEPRFWARVAWAYYSLGDLAETVKARNKCAWYTTKTPEPDPTVKLVDAALLIASGLPERALDVASKIDGLRVRVLRAQSQIDLDRPKDALDETEAVLKDAPENRQALILREEARVLAGIDAKKALDTLRSLSLAAKSKFGRHALGVARRAIKDPETQTAFEQALLDISPETPNPVAYRTLTALAELAFNNNDLLAAGHFLDWALDPNAARRPELELSNKSKIKALEDGKPTTYAENIRVNTGYFPTLALQARIVLKNNEPDRAVEILLPLIKENAAGGVQVQLTLAEGLATLKGSEKKPITASEKAEAKRQATEIIKALKGKANTDDVELGRIAALIDDKLPKDLGLPEPKPEKEDPKKKPVENKTPPKRR